MLEDYSRLGLLGLLPLLGAEGFDLLGEKVRPRMDLIADFSTLFEAVDDWAETVELSHSEARTFLAKQGSNEQVWWNFVLLSELEIKVFRGGFGRAANTAAGKPPKELCGLT